MSNYRQRPFSYVCFLGALVSAFLLSHTNAARAVDMIDLPVVKLQSLDKITARTGTFEAHVGSTVKFGSVYIKVQACRKASPIEQPESAAFLQVWEAGADGEQEPEWIFSGWMFASSPGLSPMDHPIYDVWVLDCLQKKAIAQSEQSKSGEGEIEEDQVPVEPAIEATE